MGATASVPDFFMSCRDTPQVQCCPKDLLTFCHNYQYNRYLYTII